MSIRTVKILLILGIVVIGLIWALRNSEKKAIENISNINKEIENELPKNYKELSWDSDAWYITLLLLLIGFVSFVQLVYGLWCLLPKK